jgi:hypothetical protein
VKSNFLLAIGISLVVVLGALTAFEYKHPSKSGSGQMKTELNVQVSEN